METEKQEDIYSRTSFVGEDVLPKADQDSIEMGLRILGNEVLGFYLNSSSKKKNWFITSAIILLLLSILANQLMPLILLFVQ